MERHKKNLGSERPQALTLTIKPKIYEKTLKKLLLTLTKTIY